MSKYATTVEELNELPPGTVVTPYGYTEQGYGTKLVKQRAGQWYGDNKTATFSELIGLPAEVLPETRELAETWDPFGGNK